MNLYVKRGNKIYRNMKILMFGWEFPPFKSGGLGTACYDLTKGLSRQGVEVIFVMPHAPDDADSDYVKIVGCNEFSDKIKIKRIKSKLKPYLTSEQYNLSVEPGSRFTNNSGHVYGNNLYEEVERYSIAAKFIADKEDFDVIHAHDWMTYQAGINVKKKSGKPLVVHMHATEFDRTGGNPNMIISHLEYTGLKNADIIIANSEYTKQNVIKHYNIDPEKIVVIHWGIDNDNPFFNIGYTPKLKQGNEKIILSLGRITVQKGIDCLVKAAKKVLEYEKNVKFVIVGEGDMLDTIIGMTVDYGISDKFIFTGWLKGKDVYKAFKMADIFIMPSVSEPFGLVALEAMRCGTPVMISKSSGASEVMNHVFKVDFWDTDKMADKIINFIRYNELEEDIRENSNKESFKFNLDIPAKKCIDVYKGVLSGCALG